ncbi:hypothetical protein QFC24_005148 [Naganishia onofrii]|uniref:Uncharacterized protein n=1 Tax=Naganishia onofrii TaxID=1851511 RepID=A0ACC2X8V9_9TREE|nr:hypothetical protein QFC24_005148 [Naganishia onofrii]
MAHPGCTQSETLLPQWKESKAGHVVQHMAGLALMRKLQPLVRGSTQGLHLSRALSFTPAPPTEQDPQQGLVQTPVVFDSNRFPIEPRAPTPGLLRNLDVGKMRRAFAEDHIRCQLGMLTENLKHGEWSLETRHRLVNDLIDSVPTDVLDFEIESPRVGWKIYQGGKEAPGPDTVIEWVFGWPLEGTSEEANVEGADSKSTMKAKIIAGLQSANLLRDA